MARGPRAALFFFLFCSSFFLARAQVDDLIAKVETAEGIQAEGKPVSDAVVSSIVDSAGTAELARCVIHRALVRSLRLSFQPRALLRHLTHVVATEVLSALLCRRFGSRFAFVRDCVD